MKEKLGTESYKGVRDFYPADQALHTYILDTWKRVCTSFGYEEYHASVLEPSELYRSKTSDEIVNEQTYTFTDRGDRSVTLRPEMTPTVARMVAGRRRELASPIRWFSMPNCFRYEKPQRGRVREFWQLNVDVFGISDISAEIEVIVLASRLMNTFGFLPTQYEIRINSREILNHLFTTILAVSPEQKAHIARLIDKKAKLPTEEFNTLAREILGEEKVSLLLSFLQTKDIATLESQYGASVLESTRKTLTHLQTLGVSNVVFDPTLMRGFDYYTGVIFEVFDLHPDNRRSVFGGGRYDDLLSLFGEDKIPAFGFGMGDTVLADMLETYGLLPRYTREHERTLICLSEAELEYTYSIAQTLREQNIPVSIEVTADIGKALKNCDKKGIKVVGIIGSQERETETVKRKDLATGTESSVARSNLAGF